MGLIAALLCAAAADDWTIDTAEEWTAATGASDGLELADGFARPTASVATFRSAVRKFDRARKAGVVRPLSVPQAIVNLIALSLFYPALVDQFGDAFAIDAPQAAPSRRRRRRELRETLRRALAP